MKDTDTRRRKFALLDRNEDGFISWPEFRDFLKKLGIHEDILRDRFWKSDVDYDDQISFDEFCAMLDRISTPSRG